MMCAMAEDDTWLWEISLDTNMTVSSESPRVEGGRLLRVERRGTKTVYVFQMTGPPPAEQSGTEGN